jgi:hypothetical protein
MPRGREGNARMGDCKESGYRVLRQAIIRPWPYFNQAKQEGDCRREVMGNSRAKRLSKRPKTTSHLR